MGGEDARVVSPVVPSRTDSPHVDGLSNVVTTGSRRDTPAAFHDGGTELQRSVSGGDFLFVVLGPVVESFDDVVDDDDVADGLNPAVGENDAP